MESFYDTLAAALFIASGVMYCLRLRHETPSLPPYLLVATASVAGDLLGRQGLDMFAIGVLIAASFLLLHLASLPYPDKSEDPGG